MSEMDLQRNSTTRYSAAYTTDQHSNPHEKSALLAVGAGAVPGTNTVSADWPIMKETSGRFDPERDLDDELVTPPTWRDTLRNIFSTRGAINVFVLVFIVLGIICLFVVWPVVAFFVNPKDDLGMRMMNKSGQLPGDFMMRQLIDPDTPEDVKSRAGFDGHTYKLVFSDEFNTNGRTFAPGEDPYWEAVDLNYWATDDLEVRTIAFVSCRPLTEHGSSGTTLGKP